MSMLEIEYDRRRRRMDRPASLTISGADGARIINGSNGGNVITDYWYGGSTSAGQVLTYFSTYTYTGALTLGAVEEEYDPAFVAEILAADAAPAEEGFDNVVDLLEWLNRD
jgi:hypothetical protein